MNEKMSKPEPCTARAEKEMTVDSMLTASENLTGVMKEAVQTLHERLTPVLAEEPQTAKEEDSSMSAMSNLAARIRANNFKQMEVIDTVHYLIRVLDI